jgi:hypothetical protein
VFCDFGIAEAPPGFQAGWSDCMYFFLPSCSFCFKANLTTPAPKNLHEWNIFQEMTRVAHGPRQQEIKRAPRDFDALLSGVMVFFSIAYFIRS